MTVSVVNIGSNTGVSSSSVVVTVGAGGTPAGAHIFVALCTTGTVSSIVDSAGNTPYTLVQSVANGTAVTALYRARTNVLALVNGNTVTVNYTGSCSSAVAAFYASGLANVVTDASYLNTATGTSASPSVTALGSASAPGELVVGLVGGQSLTTSFTQDSTNAAWASPPGQVSIAAPVLGGGNVVNSGTAALTYAPTFGTSDTWGALIAGFKADTVDMNSQSMMVLP